MSAAMGSATPSARVAGRLAACALAAACGGGGHDGAAAGPPYSISGTIAAAAGSAIDSDTNDPTAPFARNDSAAEAQEIPNPVTVGGHVNVAGAGPPGRTRDAGDPEDWFRVALAAGQTIRLLIAEDGTTHDLDLALRTLAGDLVATSDTASRSEEIAVAATGEYHVVVIAAAGTSNYTLAIGQTPGSAGPVAQPEFVPGEVIVRYRDELPRDLARRSAAQRAAALGMRLVAGARDREMLLVATTPEERVAALGALGLAADPARELARRRAASGAEATAILREDTRRLAQALRARPEIASADLNYVRRPAALPADELYRYQWHFDLINLPTAWDVVASDSGVVVAVADTGIKAGHPDFSGQLVAGYDFIRDPDRAKDGDGCDADPEDPGDAPDPAAPPSASSFHGTHVAGTVAARTSLQGGNTQGVAGVAWNARVMPLRVLGVEGGTDMDIMAALRFAADRDNDCGVRPAAPAQIVNLSLGGSGFNQTFQDLVTELRNDAGLIFVAAAGNAASSAPFYPAAYDGVISVSAVGQTKTLAPYSNFGATIDVAAPGGDFSRDVNGDGFPDGVLSTFFGDAGFGYAFYQGTSMAAPHVAGVIALMLGIDPDLTPFDIDNALVAGELTEDLGSPQSFGNGLIDAVAAVNRAGEGSGGATVLDPVLRVDPGGLNYGLLADDFAVSASNGGNAAEPLTLVGVTFTSQDGAAWLTVVPEAVDAQGLGRYRATVDRSALADGLYTGTLRFDSDRNDVDLPVIMQVGDAVSAGPDAGHHFVLLVDPATNVTVAQLEVDASNGSYAFRFDGVDPGDLLVIAGTDSDNDNFICDDGEACGAYPTTAAIVPITLDANRSDLQFVTGFRSDLSAARAGEPPPPRGYSRRVGEGPASAQP